MRDKRGSRSTPAFKKKKKPINFRKFMENLGKFGKNMNIWNISRSNRKDYSSIFFFGAPRVIIVNSLIYISNIVVNPSYMLLNVSTLRCKYWLIKWKGLSEYRKYEVYLDFLQVIIFEKKKLSRIYMIFHEYYYC